ncbi:ER oxidoreductin Ero1a [Schizosaccharomyces japonicus yFS275]|uniref:ER oxidoreductin Ero1a n=1 Tax=Schizosaccharomyces japonicus (strain yFS275 / FY16936) TaxID=402676 RepID=B6K1A2_SCHJY|nr:ER oxidoreductin Ero1a [Schizosaccharomyces japonicus yFS275]EEB07723.1 ER oxidoreductin Ero1a [Schizosaccharomyces japonicus yFS275]
MKVSQLFTSLSNAFLLLSAPIADTELNQQQVYQMNTRVRTLIPVLTERSDYFSHYKINLYDEDCPLWDNNNAMCSNRGCAVDTLNETEIPEVWRTLSALAPSSQSNSTACMWKPDSRMDYCYWDDEDDGTNSHCVYVSLVKNPERFTGYAGEHSNLIWKSIYEQNCFPASETKDDAEASTEIGTLDVNSMDPFAVKSVEEAAEMPGACLEKRMFNRLISGFHASISTHVCQEYFNAETQRWESNLDFWMAKVGYFPERVENIFFNYAVLHQALVRLSHLIHESPNNTFLSFCPANAALDENTRLAFDQLTGIVAQDPHVVSFEQLFSDDSSRRVKEEFRNRFRNISRIMNCVGCDKCRLWGKVQTAGYGTALKLLLEPETKLSDLRPAEVVALVNTFGRISRSVDSVFSFTIQKKTNDILAYLDSFLSYLPMPLSSLLHASLPLLRLPIRWTIFFLNLVRTF